MRAFRQHVICAASRISAPSSLAFEPYEEVARGFARVLQQLGTQARHLAQRKYGTLPESVHDTRVLIKFVRALVWFARPAFSSSEAHRAKSHLRKAAHLLADQRELAVTRAISKGLSRKTEDSGYRIALGRIANDLDDHLALTANPYHALKQAAATVLTKSGNLSEQQQTHLPGHPVPIGWSKPAAPRNTHASEPLRPKTLCSSTTGEKKPRDCCLLQLTQLVPSKGMARTINRVDKLQEKLGDYHDCVIALGRLQKLPPCLTPPLMVRGTVNLLEIRKDHMRKKLKGMTKHIKLR